ncbi:XRE family transcriptional regulator [Sphingomonas sp. UV9]|uniref:helix-turn-helix domain-containing protein n=1 Tax=Sphingomonas sp. UV9 TaxID=1851410 RepID=UPI000FFBB816|nr:helix-turn-helix transcriptional regulator [Sphingomonas sp. UV9]RXD05546.1 XRE family transcriptional regulator [Sphingomonas sp. UV9]
MIVSERVRERMVEVGLSQSELARRVGVAQPTIYKLLHTAKKGSTKLHLIARELRTTPAYLSGETDDPDLNAPPPQPAAPPMILMSVNLPPERALARMFIGLLAGIDPKASRDEQALLLAQRLPIGLSQLRDLLPDPVTPDHPERADVDEARAMPHPEPIR